MNATFRCLRSSFVIAALLVSSLVSSLISSLAFAQGETASSATAVPAPAKSGGLLQDFDTLGGNDVLLDKARELNPESTISVVQDRIVNRRSRFEVAPQFSSVLGGDAYSSTRSVGAAAYYHITPRWAIGANYLYHTNSLRAEGQHLINERPDHQLDGKFD